MHINYNDLINKNNYGLKSVCDSGPVLARYVGPASACDSGPLLLVRHWAIRLFDGGAMRAAGIGPGFFTTLAQFRAKHVLLSGYSKNFGTSLVSHFCTRCYDNYILVPSNLGIY